MGAALLRRGLFRLFHRGLCSRTILFGAPCAGTAPPTRLFWGSQPGLIWVPRTAAGEPGRPLLGSVRDVEPLAVELVREPAQRLLFRELVGRYHYLGHRVPFGAHLRYLVFASRPARAVVGCLQFSSPA